MSSVEPLLKVAVDSCFVSLVCDVRSVAEQAMGWADSGLTVRVVRGRKARTRQGLFDEFSAAFQFPYYFGENWPAFGECLSDMDWLPMPMGVVALIYDAAQLLADEPQVEMDVFVRLIGEAHATYSQPIALGEWWDRPAVPFHVVIQDEVLDGLARWGSSGAAVTPLVPRAR